MSSAPRADDVRVAVFAKAPVPGTVKTRLAAELGATRAASLHAMLVERALQSATEAAIGDVELWCAPDERHAFFARCAERFGARLHRQQGADLGARMAFAFDTAFAAARSLVLVGSDCPALAPEDFRAAADALRTHDAAIAPAEDGGYVLIALRRAVPGLFEDIDWGSPRVMGQTRERLDHAGIAWKELATRWDVDRPEDCERLRREGLFGTAAW